LASLYTKAKGNIEINKDNKGNKGNNNNFGLKPLAKGAKSFIIIV